MIEMRTWSMLWENKIFNFTSLLARLNCLCQLAHFKQHPRLQWELRKGDMCPRIAWKDIIKTSDKMPERGIKRIHMLENLHLIMHLSDEGTGNDCSKIILRKIMLYNWLYARVKHSLKQALPAANATGCTETYIFSTLT